MTSLALDNDDGCFVCGKANPIGLKLDFVTEGDDYVTYFTPAKEHQGWVGIVHGGIVATVLDEVMTRGIHVKGISGVTADLSVRYRKPTPVGKRLRFAGRVESESKRIISCSATATDEDGVLLAEATARVMVTRP